MSAAHRAAPTVLVKANTSEAKGIISSKNDAIPKLQKDIVSNGSYSLEGKKLTRCSRPDSVRYMPPSDYWTTVSTGSSECEQLVHCACPVER